MHSLTDDLESLIPPWLEEIRLAQERIEAIKSKIEDVNLLVDNLTGRIPFSGVEEGLIALSRAQELLAERPGRLASPKQAPSPIRVIAEASSTTGNSRLGADESPGPPDPQRYAGLSAVEASKHVLRDAAGEFLHHSVIASRLLGGGFRPKNPAAEFETISRSILDELRRLPHIFSRRQTEYFQLASVVPGDKAWSSGLEPKEPDPESWAGLVLSYMRAAQRPVSISDVASHAISLGRAQEGEEIKLKGTIHNVFKRSQNIVKVAPGLWALAGQRLAEPKSSPDIGEPRFELSDSNSKPKAKDRPRIRRSEYVARVLDHTGRPMTVAEMIGPVRELGYGIDMKDNVIESSIRNTLNAASELFRRLPNAEGAGTELKTDAALWALTDEGQQYAQEAARASQ